MTVKKERAAFICVKDTIDGAYPSLVLAINAARQGMESKIFYSFMGLNMVKRGGAARAKFIKKKIEKANIPPLSELQEMAQLEGVELIACKMSIDMMEIDESELVEGVLVWTAEDFLKYAKDCKLCLFT